MENNDLNCNDFHSEPHLAFASCLENRPFIFKGERRETNFEHILYACLIAKYFHLVSVIEPLPQTNEFVHIVLLIDKEAKVQKLDKLP